MKRIALFISVLVILSLSVTFFYHKTQKSDINYYSGRRYFEKGAYGKAVFFYENALAADPGRIDALVDLAYICQWTGDTKRAIGLLQKALAIREDDSLKTALARSYAWEGEYKQAINIYNELDRAADSPGIKKELAQVYIWNRQFDKARDILTQLTEEYPADREVKLLLAKALQYSGNPREAAGIYEGLLKEREEGE
ncbi:MAG: tetratricopeptide repeat protein [Candidatus Omnitrophica bacterium]|nr:tetratricopeptide repeat protein [Candidatus Omnitrophota bacterium]MDD5500666.1 tetratricopeptide repeat protein [Candidatus Omnitrophota bacterium]